MLQTIQFKLTGAAPLLLHSGQTVDPSNYYSKQKKQISGKRSKTDADFDYLKQLDWYASLYVDDDKRVIIPAENLEACFRDGAKKLKLGKQASAGAFIEESPLLVFDGDNLSPDELWQRGKNILTVAARISSSKVMVSRFCARQWSCTFVLSYDDETFNTATVVDIMSIAGRSVGVGTWRPKFGRFTVDVVT